MPRTLIKSGLQFNKHKPRIKEEMINTKSNLPLHLLSFKQKLLSGNGFIEYGSWLNNSDRTNEFFNWFFIIYMSLEDFQLLDNEPLDNSIIKRDFTKIYHRQSDQLNQPDQNIEFNFVENNKYHPIGNAYLEFNITVRKNDDTNFRHDDPVRLVNNWFAFCFKEGRLSTTIGSDFEINKFSGQVSTIMRVISNEDGDLLSQFDNINRNDIQILERLANLPPQNRDTLHQKMLLNNHTDAKKGKIKRHLFSEDIFGFCETFEKVTKNLGFNIVFKTNDLHNIINSSMADDMWLLIVCICMYQI